MEAILNEQTTDRQQKFRAQIPSRDAGVAPALTRWSDSGAIGPMKIKTLLLTFTLFCLAAIVCLASPHMGTWKLNEAKSKFAPGATKNHTVVYAAAGDQVKVTVDGTDAQGKSIHNEWTGKFDGKDYPVTGDPTSDTRSYKQAGENKLEMTVKKDGKVTVTGNIVVAADGKTRTVTTSGTDDKGAKVENTAVYDKQ
jgi:hypothetical protein